MALYFVGFQRGSISAIGIGVKTGTPSTGTSRIKIKRLVRLSGDPQISEFLDASDSSKALASRYIASNEANVEFGVANAVLRDIVAKNKSIKEKIETLIRIANGIDFDADKYRSSLFSEQQDALRSALKAFNVKIPNYEDGWEYDSYTDSSTYLDGFDNEFTEEMMTEDDIINHDSKFFGDYVSVGSVNVKTKAFSDGNNTILVTMENRNAVEDVLGVDMVYYNENEESFCFIQYKRMKRNKKGTAYSYYPSSDGNYQKDIETMSKHSSDIEDWESIMSGSELEDFRLIDCNFWFNFVKSHNFEPIRNQAMPGMYVPISAWNSFISTCAKRNETPKACSETMKRNLSSDEFTSLYKKGLIGTRYCTVDSIISVLSECIKGNRSAVFVYKVNGTSSDESSTPLQTTADQTAPASPPQP